MPTLKDDKKYMDRGMDGEPSDTCCPSCGGNDGDTPCAYPSEGKPGCLRDIRLQKELG